MFLVLFELVENKRNSNGELPIITYNYFPFSTYNNLRDRISTQCPIHHPNIQISLLQHGIFPREISLKFP
jgi:hypothetical protein